MVLRVKNRSEYTYRCKICGFENSHTQMPQTTIPVTGIGDYGYDATPTPTTNNITVYTATSISFRSASGDVPAKLSDSLYRFADKHIKPSWNITIETESGTNDGSYTIAEMGVARGEISLTTTASTPNYLMIAGEYVIIAGEYVTIGDATNIGLINESAQDAGQVTIKKVSYKPQIIKGCPLCGSLNSR